MGSGAVQVHLETVWDVEDNVTVNGMAVGATIHQLSNEDRILAASDQAGIDIRVLSPPPFTYRYWNDPAESLALCRLLNDATAAVVDRHPQRFRGLATVPLQDTETAINELERARQLGLVGVTIGTNIAGANVSDPAHRPFLEAVAGAGIPILVHPDFVPERRTSSYYLINLVGMPVETAISMANMLFSGVFDEFPDLRVCFMHGGGAGPYLFGRWNTGWRLRSEVRADSSRLPTEYLTNIYCDTLTHSAAALSHLVEVIGAENVVVGTDLPFDVEDPDPLRHLAAAPRLTDSDRETIKTVSPVRWLTGNNPS
jgi:aminocarboxymuconate-semialdehyde decarboxylase